jgi:flagellar biosynthetic protein FlhB
MAEDQDKSQKTEDPTGKRLDEAFKSGNVPKSQELNHWFMLSGSGLAVALFAGQVAGGLQPLLEQFLGLAHDLPTDAGHLQDMFAGIGWDLVKLLSLPVLILVIAAIAANVLQHKPTLAWKKLKPEFSKISPAKGLKRMFGPQGALNMVKSLLKLVIIGGVALAVVWPDLRQLKLFATMELPDVVGFIHYETIVMVTVVVLVMTVLAGFDLFYQRYDWFQNLKMSRQDVKDEHKQAEGDPHVRARIRQLRSERTRQRMMAAVPTADVVVTNPTHYAVALKYDGESMAAPKMVAKGQDLIALKIREVAAENDVPIIENPPLARGLYAAVEIDQEVPPEFYKAVAEVIGYVMRLKGKLKPKPTVRAT